MLESIEAMSLLTIMEIVGPILLAAALIYGTVQWRRRRQPTKAATEAATRRLYREGAKEERLEADLVSADIPAEAQNAPKGSPNPHLAGRLRSGREGDRASEDDIVRTHLGPRGLPGERATTKILDEKQTQIPKALDPGHTA